MMEYEDDGGTEKEAEFDEDSVAEIEAALAAVADEGEEVAAPVNEPLIHPLSPNTNDNIDPAEEAHDEDDTM